jgi:hypothetical protein
MYRPFVFMNILRIGFSGRQDTRCLMAIHPQPHAMTAAATVLVTAAEVEKVTANGGDDSSSSST